jgi:membrane-bound serine protease (ClpP class)
MVDVSIGVGLIILGAILLISEASAPGFFVGAIGTACIAMGLMAMVVGDAILTSMWAPVVFVGVTLGGMAFSILFYQRLGALQKPKTTVADSLIGKTGMVTVETDPDSETKGKVKISSTVWSATSDFRLREGTKVEVVEAEGVHVKVRRIKAAKKN